MFLTNRAPRLKVLVVRGLLRRGELLLLHAAQVDLALPLLRFDPLLEGKDRALILAQLHRLLALAQPPPSLAARSLLAHRRPGCSQICRI